MAYKFLNGVDLNSKNITSVADAVNPTDAVNLQQLQATAAGLDWKDNVRVASTANLAVASAVINGASVDGVSLVTGNRILLKNQTTASENGIYIVAATGAASRSTDADTSADITNMVVRVSEGTASGDLTYQLITDNVTLGSTSLVYTLFGAGISYTADGNGIELASTVFSIELDGTTLTKSASGIRIGSGAAGNGLVESTGVLAVNPGTGISISSDQVIVDTSIVVRKFSADCVATTNPQTFTHNLGTKDVQVTVREASSDALIGGDVVASTTNAVSVNFGGAPTSAQYRVTVFG